MEHPSLQSRPVDNTMSSPSIFSARCITILAMVGVWDFGADLPEV